MQKKKYIPPHLRNQNIIQPPTPIANKRNKIFSLVEFENNRVHEAQLVLLTICSSGLTQYDILPVNERQEINKLLFQIYDIYQPKYVEVNCGHKTDNKNPKVHWKLNYDKDEYKLLLKCLIRNINNNDTKEIMKHYFKHFNQKYSEFFTTKKYLNIKYILDDINLYKSLNIKNFKDIPQYDNKLNEYNIKIDLNDNNPSFKIIINTNEANPKMINYIQRINASIETLILFIHNSTNCIKKCLSMNMYKYNQALEWFEIKISTNKQFINISCNVTIFHFIFIISQNKTINSNKWIKTYFQTINEQFNELSINYFKASCDYNHYGFKLCENEKKIKETMYLGNGVGNGGKQKIFQYSKYNNSNTYDDMPPNRSPYMHSSTSSPYHNSTNRHRSNYNNSPSGSGSASGSGPSRSYRNINGINDDWRKAGPPNLDPPSNVNVNPNTMHGPPPRNFFSNNTHNTSRRYDSRRSGYRGGKSRHYNNNGSRFSNPSQRRQPQQPQSQSQPQQEPYVVPAQNQAVIDDNPYDKSPFNQKNYAAPLAPPIIEYDNNGNIITGNLNDDIDDIDKGWIDMDDDDGFNNDNNNNPNINKRFTNQNHKNKQNNDKYVLQKGFQELNMNNPTQTRSQRRRRNNNNNNNNNNNRNTIIGTLNNSNNSKNKNKNKNNLYNSPKNRNKNKKSPKMLSHKTATNSVSLNVMKSKKKNKSNAKNPWAAIVKNDQQKQKKNSQQIKPIQQQHQQQQIQQQKPKSYPMASSTFQPHSASNNNNKNNNINEYRHVLEVSNAIISRDHQSVTMMFRHHLIEYQTIFGLNGRVFVVFDRSKTALNALNIVKDNHFKLKQINIKNKKDMDLLAGSSVPPPIRPKTDNQMANRLINNHLRDRGRGSGRSRGRGGRGRYNSNRGRGGSDRYKRSRYNNRGNRGGNNNNMRSAKEDAEFRKTNRYNQQMKKNKMKDLSSGQGNSW